MTPREPASGADAATRPGEAPLATPASRPRGALPTGLAVLGVILALLTVNVVELSRGCEGVGPIARGRPAPLFELPGTSGARVSLAGLRGRVVLLDFWSATCAPCLRSMPVLAELQRELGGRGLQILSINIDGEREAALAQAARTQGSLTMLLDDGSAAQRYAVQTIPYLVVVGRDGRVRSLLVGAVRESRLKAQLLDALAAAPPR